MAKSKTTPTLFPDRVWTIAAYATHNEAMRVAEQRFQDERDKRYAEGNELRAMALKIKETADANALELASESQTYKEARNDAMREQNLKETGVYATRDDLALVVKKFETALQPLSDYITGQQGSHKTGQNVASNSFKAIAAISSILVILGVFVAVVMAVMK